MRAKLFSLGIFPEGFVSFCHVNVLKLFPEEIVSIRVLCKAFVSLILAFEVNFDLLLDATNYAIIVSMVCLRLELSEIQNINKPLPNEFKQGRMHSFINIPPLFRFLIKILAESLRVLTD